MTNNASVRAKKKKKLGITNFIQETIQATPSRCVTLRSGVIAWTIRLQNNIRSLYTTKCRTVGGGEWQIRFAAGGVLVLISTSLQ